MTARIVFDIETGPASLDDLRSVMAPFDRTSIPKPSAEFDESSVKIGNLKDEKKIAAKVEAARREHAQSLTDYDKNLQAAETEYWQTAVDGAALDASTGHVLAIGYRGEKSLLDHIREGRTERDLLDRFWQQFERCRAAGRKLVGFNIAGFDIPFLTQRSWILGVCVPDSVFTPTGYIEPTFVDLMRVWSAGVRNNYVKLTTVCQACGLGAKTDGINGGDFAGLFFNPETQGIALEYLENDLDMTAKLAERLGVC